MDTMMQLAVKQSSRFEYIEEGVGTPLVLLHGLMGGLSNFEFLIDKFKDSYKVFIPKLPLYSLEVEDTTVENIALEVLQFLEEVVKEPAIFIGNSLGGHIGLILTVEHPKWVKGLLLTGSSGLYEKSFGETFPKRGDYEYVSKKTREVFYDPEVATKDIVDDVFDVVNDREKALRTLYIARSAMKHNMKGDLPSIKVPVGLIWGKQDDVTPPEVAVEFDKEIENTTLYWIDKCGHAPMMEHPKEFNGMLEEWLKKENLL